MITNEEIAAIDAAQAAQQALDAPIIAAAQERGSRRPGYTGWGSKWCEIAYDVSVGGVPYEVRKRLEAGRASWRVMR